MFLHNLGAGLLRRWYFVLVGILLTATGGFVTWTVVPPSYEATSTAVLLPPSSLVGENGNPYLYMGGLDQVLTVLTVRLNSTEVGEPLLQGRGNVAYTAQRDSTIPGPIMLVTATAESRESAMQLLRDVVDIVPENLSLMQDQLRIPTFSRVEVMTVVQDAEPDLMLKDQIRTLLAAVAVGLAVTVLATAVLDRIMTNRKIRKVRRTRSRTEASSTLQQPRGSGLVAGSVSQTPATAATAESAAADPDNADLEFPALASKK